MTAAATLLRLRGQRFAYDWANEPSECALHASPALDARGAD